MRDFTLNSFQLLLKSFLNKGYEFHDLVNFTENSSGKKIFLRHDIDRYTNRIEKFAVLEKNLGIRSTFYFRTPHKPVHVKMIETVVKNHHDIGYHYNDLAEHKGNVRSAMQSFSDTLSVLRTMAEVKSICMHGNVRSSINNLDLIKEIDLTENGLTGDPYIMIDHHNVLYLTDTCRCWNCDKFSKWDRVQSGFNYHPLSTTAIIADMADSCLPDKLHLCIHPQHYHDSIVKWAAYYLERSVRNRIKTIFIMQEHA